MDRKIQTPRRGICKLHIVHPCALSDRVSALSGRVGTGCSGYKIFGPPNQSGKIFGRSVEFGWSLVVTNKSKLNGKQGKLGEYVVSVVTYLPKDH